MIGHGLGAIEKRFRWWLGRLLRVDWESNVYPGGEPEFRVFDEAYILFHAGDVRGAQDFCERAAAGALAKGHLALAMACFHMACLYEMDPRKKLRWDRQALGLANAILDRAAPIYASLYSNLAFAYAAIDDLHQAVRYHELALKHVPTLEPATHRDTYRRSSEAQLVRLRALIAERET